MGKLLKKMAEETLITVRSLRDDANKKIKATEAEKTIGEDQLFKTKEKIQGATEKANAQIEELVEKKSGELSL